MNIKQSVIDILNDNFNKKMDKNYQKKFNYSKSFCYILNIINNIFNKYINIKIFYINKNFIGIKEEGNILTGFYFNYIDNKCKFLLLLKNKYYRKYYGIRMIQKFRKDIEIKILTSLIELNRINILFPEDLIQY